MLMEMGMEVRCPEAEKVSRSGIGKSRMKEDRAFGIGQNIIAARRVESHRG